ncbi:MAG: polysaccharide biosynthesis/export family protein [Planctomycetes bacterium]|nr:polysaccharide biosynthesis/export family protein [Planctomycetota bacterium]
MVRATGCAALIIGISGCATKRADILHFLRENDHEVSAIEYRVGIPDELAITAPRIPEIDNEAQRVRPDGKINLRLLGEVKIVGMTAKEIAAKLEVLLSRYYVDPKVAVRVTGYLSKKYYIYGLVSSVGPRPYTGRDTLLDAVVNAGTTYLSWTSNVQVIRPAHGDVPVRIIHVDVDQMVKKGDWSKNVLLEPNDTVYVPPTPLAWFGLKVREVLYPVNPAIQAYTTPAQIKSVEHAYDNANQSNTSYIYGSVTPY